MNGQRHYLGGIGFAEADGPVAVTAGQFDSVVRVWDLDTRRVRSQWTYKETAQVAYSGVHLLATSRRRGQPIIVTADGSRVQVWSLPTRTLLADLTGHAGRIHSLRIAELDGDPILITASDDSTARLWNLDKLEGLEPPLAEHTGSVHAATVGRFGGEELAFTGDEEGVVRAWNPASRSEIPVNLPRLQKWVSCLIAGELYDKSVLIIGGGDGTLRVWCRETGEVILEAQLNTTPQDVVVRPPGDLCVATAMGIVALRMRNWTEEVLDEPADLHTRDSPAVQGT
jgi:WD40 repeat protein